MSVYLECGTHAAITTCTSPVEATTTITTVHAHAIAAGDRIELKVPDRNRWRRFWHFITFRDPPMLKTYYTVTSVYDATTMEVA